MAEATTTHGFWELMRIARWHVEGDAFERALAVVVEAQAALPMAAFRGTGRTALQRRSVLPGRPAGAKPSTLVNARGRARRQGVLACLRPVLPVRHPDRPSHRPRSALHPRRAPDERDRAARPANKYVDTGGFTDHVMRDNADADGASRARCGVLSAGRSPDVAGRTARCDADRCQRPPAAAGRLIIARTSRRSSARPVSRRPPFGSTLFEERRLRPSSNPVAST